MSPLLQTFANASLRGFFAASGGAAPAYELISTVYGTGSSGTITFSSIPQTYKHLQIRFVGNNATTQFSITLNSDSGSNYARHLLYGSGASVASTGIGSQSSFLIPLSLPQTQANVYGAGLIDILDYVSTSKNKTLRYFGGVHSTATTTVSLQSGLWMNTATITAITISAGGNWLTGSRFSLYGIKG